MRDSKRYAALLRALVALLFLPPLMIRCASIMTPEGGPKDTLPPVIVNMLPDNFSTNRSTTDHEKIYIEFNEYVQIKDQQKEFFTSPEMKKKPTLSIRGRGVVVQLRDTLLPNTTYALNFGSAIRDNNESNPLFSMRYVFSTGPEIDSMVMSGYTEDSYKADSVSKAFIWFFPADSVEDHPEYDSTLFKYKPAVIARAENNGIFIAQNLKPIRYRVYAIGDENDNQMYDPGTDMVGFISESQNPAYQEDFAIWYDSVRRYVSAEPQLYFRMFTDKAFRRQNLSEALRPLQHKAVLHFGAPRPEIHSIRFDSIAEEQLIVDPQGEGRDTVALWFNVPSAMLPDTLRGEITYVKHDTVNELHPVTEPLTLTWTKIETKEEQKERERLEREREKAEEAGEEWTPPAEENPFVCKFSSTSEVNPEKHLSMDFDYPLVKVDTTALLLTFTDDKQAVSDVPMTIERDTANICRWHLRADWKRGGEYTLTIPQGALTDVAGFSNDSIVNKYVALDPEKYATVKITVRGRSEGAKYIIQLLDSGGKLKQERRDVTSGLVQFNYVEAGEVKFRVVEDANGNGRWDGGSVVERRQPERTEPYVSEEGEEILATKANWEMEFTMDMNKIFAPVTMRSLARTLDEREEQRLIREEEERRKNPKKNQNNNNHNRGGHRGGSGSLRSGGMGSTGGGLGGMMSGMR